MSSSTVQELLVFFKEMPSLISLILNTESEKTRMFGRGYWVVKRNGTNKEVTTRTLYRKAKDPVDLSSASLVMAVLLASRPMKNCVVSTIIGKVSFI